MYRTVLLYNPAAGRRSRAHLIQKAADFLRSRHWEVTVKQSANAGEFQQLAAQAVADQVEVLTVVGGDGSVNLATRVLAGSSTALAVIPTGTSNVWALEIGSVKHPIPSESEIWPAIELLAASQRRQVDIGVANGTPFLLWAGIGLDGLAIHHIEPRPRWSKWIPVQHYAAYTIAQLLHWRGMKLSIEIEDRLVSDQCTVMIMANASRYMGGMTVFSPQMRLDDGLLDAWLIEGSSILESFDQAFRLMQNRHHWERVKHITFQSLRVSAPEPLWLQVDGDPVRGSTWPLEVRVQPRGLWVLTPPPPRDLYIF